MEASFRDSLPFSLLPLLIANPQNLTVLRNRGEGEAAPSSAAHGGEAPGLSSGLSSGRVPEARSPAGCRVPCPPAAAGGRSAPALCAVWPRLSAARAQTRGAVKPPGPPSPGS